MFSCFRKNKRNVFVKYCFYVIQTWGWLRKNSFSETGTLIYCHITPSSKSVKMKVSIIEINFKEISVQTFRNSDMLLIDITVRTEWILT